LPWSMFLLDICLPGSMFILAICLPGSMFLLAICLPGSRFLLAICLPGSMFLLAICLPGSRYPQSLLRQGLGRVWRCQRGNQNPYIKEEQTTQCQKQVQKDRQRPTKHTHKTKDEEMTGKCLRQVEHIRDHL
jgi:hypothetical protein